MLRESYNHRRNKAYCAAWQGTNLVGTTQSGITDDSYFFGTISYWLVRTGLCSKMNYCQNLHFVLFYFSFFSSYFTSIRITFCGNNFVSCLLYVFSLHIIFCLDSQIDLSKFHRCKFGINGFNKVRYMKIRCESHKCTFKLSDTLHHCWYY